MCLSKNLICLKGMSLVITALHNKQALTVLKCNTSHQGLVCQGSVARSCTNGISLKGPSQVIAGLTNNKWLTVSNATLAHVGFYISIFLWCAAAQRWT